MGRRAALFRDGLCLLSYKHQLIFYSRAWFYFTECESYTESHISNLITVESLRWKLFYSKLVTLRHGAQLTERLVPAVARSGHYTKATVRALMVFASSLCHRRRSVTFELNRTIRSWESKKMFFLCPLLLRNNNSSVTKL